MKFCLDIRYSADYRCSVSFTVYESRLFYAQKSNFIKLFFINK